MKKTLKYSLFTLLSCGLILMIASAFAFSGQKSSPPPAQTKEPGHDKGGADDMNRTCNFKVPAFKLSRGAFRTFRYDIDQQLDSDYGNPRHGAICLSSNGPAGPDSITWLRGSKKKFTIEYVPIPKDASQNCPPNPFDQPLPEHGKEYVRVDTGAPNADIKDCMYQVKIQKSEAKAADDPHIIINK